MTHLQLARGDTVALVAPSSRAQASDADFLGRATVVLEGWGLSVRPYLPTDGHLYLAGTDEDRADAFLSALADPDIRGIFAVRGGYGAARILSRVARSGIDREVFLVGCSDATSLHCLSLAHFPSWRCVHGPNVATTQFLSDAPTSAGNRQMLHDALFDPQPYALAAETLLSGTAKGTLVGGCLSIIVSLVGTPYLPDLRGRILFLEDVGERPYRIDRMLTQLLNAGVLDHVAGIAFGEMIRCADEYNDLKAIIVELLRPLSTPVLFGVASGHGPVNNPLPLGCGASIDGAGGRLLIGL